jgi:hypothetical protein
MARGHGSFKVIKDTSCKIFAGLTQGTVKVLSNPEAGLSCEEGVVMSLGCPGYVVEEGWTTRATPSEAMITE